MAVAEGHLLFRLADGTALETNDADSHLRHLEPGWASTPGAPQVGKARHVIAAVGTTASRLAAEEDLYAALAGVPGSVRLVTDSSGRLADLLKAPAESVLKRSLAARTIARPRDCRCIR